MSADDRCCSCSQCLDVYFGSDTDFKKNNNGPQMKCRLCGKQRSVVLVCNAVAAAMHTALFVALLTLVFLWDIKLERNLSQKISVWENATASELPLRDACFHSDECAIPSPKIFVETADGDKFNVYAKEVDFGSLSLTWLVLSFSLLSAVFQGLRPFMSAFEKCFRPCFDCCKCCNLDDAPSQRPGSMYLTEDVMRGVNSSRFVEYSASATVMILCIAFVLNVDAYETVVALAALTACCQLSGLVAELLLERSERGYKSELFPAAWLLHGIGWLQMGATFWLVLLRFQQSVAEANSSDKVEAPPAFVYAIVYGQLAFFSSFGFVQLGDFVHRTCYAKPPALGEPSGGCCSERKCMGCPSRECVELWYISLSLTSKVVLSVLVAANLFLDPERDA